MKCKKKLVTVCSGLILIVGMLSGCAVRSNTTLSEEAKQTQIAFSWWGNDERHQYTLKGVDLFEKQNPDITVKCNYAEWNGFVNRMNLEMASNTEADVMQINYSWLNEYKDAGGNYYDLNLLADELELDNYTEEELSYGTNADGKLCALPIAMNTQTLYYNKSIYDAYNLPLPKTWEDLYAAAAVMREDGVYPTSVQINQLALLLVVYTEEVTGKQFMEMDGTINFNQDDIKIMLDFYKKLIDEKVIPHIEAFERSKIVDGTFAGSMAWISDGENYWGDVIKSGQDVEIGDYLVGENAQNLGWYMKPATLYAISANTQAPQTAAKLLDYLVNSPDMALLQGTEKGVPISDAARETMEENKLLSGIQYDANQKMLEYSDTMRLVSPYFENSDLISGFKAEADLYLYEKEDIETCAENISQIFSAYRD